MTKFMNSSKTGSRGSLLWSLRWRTWAHLVRRLSVSRSQGKKKKENGCGYFVGPWVSEKCLGVVKNKYINLLSAGQLADQCVAWHQSNKHLLYMTGLVSANLALNKGFLNKLSSFARSSKVHNTKNKQTQHHWSFLLNWLFIPDRWRQNRHGFSSLFLPTNIGLF